MADSTGRMLNAAWELRGRIIIRDPDSEVVTVTDDQANHWISMTLANDSHPNIYSYHEITWTAVPS